MRNLLSIFVSVANPWLNAMYGVPLRTKSSKQLKRKLFFQNDGCFLHTEVEKLKYMSKIDLQKSNYCLCTPGDAVLGIVGGGVTFPFF